MEREEGAAQNAFVVTPNEEICVCDPEEFKTETRTLRIGPQLRLS